MRAHRLLRTKYCSVVAAPSLTSWVHRSSGSLMAKALSMANAMSRKSRLSMPRSSMAWLSGLILSGSMSQVSAMMLATVSKVEGIGKSLSCLAFRPDREGQESLFAGHSRGRVGAAQSRAARIPKRAGEFNAAAALTSAAPSDDFAANPGSGDFGHDDHHEDDEQHQSGLVPVQV